MTLRKPITLVGGTLEGGTPFGLAYPPPIILDGPGRGTVTLIGVETGRQFLFGSLNSAVPPGITGGGFDQLHVIGCTIRAPSFCSYGYDGPYCSLDGAGEGQPGIAVDVPLIVVEDSFVEGSPSDSEGYQYVRAAPGIRARNSVVAVIGSEVHGGNAGRYYLPAQYSCGGGSRQAWQVHGGAAIECLELHRLSSKLLGGRGAQWSSTSPPSPGFCYYSADGPEVVLAGSGPLLRIR